MTMRTKSCLTLSLAALFLSSCVSAGDILPPGRNTGSVDFPLPRQQTQQPGQQQPQQQQQQSPRPPANQQRNAIGPALDSFLFEKWRAFPGKTGIAVERIDGGGTVGQRLDDMFPQQSVSKLWVAVTILDQIDQGRLQLSTPVRVTYDDFTMFQSVIKSRVERDGPQTETVGQLMEWAILKSDNTANDKLLWLAGGPDVVRSTLASKGVTGVRFGPGERELQSRIAGFGWKQSYGPGNTWFNVRSTVSNDVRRNAMRAYVANPIDGATPRGMVGALAKLARGELLSAGSTRHLLGLMNRVTSGPNRLKAGVPSGWQFGHKTGTGQNLGGWATGYNDAGIMTAPDGTRYAVTVLLAETTASIPERMRLMQSVTSAVGSLH